MRFWDTVTVSPSQPVDFHHCVYSSITPDRLDEPDKASTLSNYSTGHLLSMQLWIPNRVNTYTYAHTGSIHQLQTCTCSTWLLWSQGGRGRSSRWSEGIRLQAADCVGQRGVSEKSFIYCPCLTFQHSHSVYNKRHAYCLVTSMEVYILKSK